VEDEERRGDQAYCCGRVVPAQMLAEIDQCEDGEDAEGDDLLDHFELDRREVPGTDPVRRNLQAVFKESDAPADQDDLPERVLAVFQVAVPGNGHEDVGEDEQDYCPHD
jgi:hypothetical protein